MGKSQSTQASGSAEANYANCVRFALVGRSGCGKSAFVNAVRGINDEHELAAEVDYIETGAGPTEYTHPANPLVSFCDLPGYDTPNYPDIPNYWNRFKLEKFDKFLIFIPDRMSGLDVALQKKIKSVSKSFFLIRTKVDVACDAEMRKRQFNEKEMLDKIRNDMVKKKTCTEENIFLISNYDTDKWDFFRLIEAIISVLPVPPIDPTKDPTELEYLADVKEYMSKNGVDGINDFLKNKLERSKEVKIRFAVTGNSGAGKSTFINAIRGLADDDYDNGAAEVDVVEATKIPTEYKHPENKMISFWDLPGIGTPNYPDLDTYCEKVGLEDYDIFLIFTASRFTDYDLQLAKKVKSIGKSFFLIRSKIDVDHYSDKKKKAFNEEAMLQKIRKDCLDNVKDLISNENNIFLISNYDPDKWDFDRLIEAISDALPVLQREALILSLSNMTRGCIKRKAKFLKAQSVVVAVLSGVAGAIAVDIAIDGAITGVIESSIAFYYKEFGLNNLPPEELATLEKKLSTYAKKYGFNIKPGPVVLSLKRLLQLLVVKEAAKYALIVGSVIAGSTSFVCTLRYLLSCVSELEEAALAVLDNAATQVIQDNLPETSIFLQCDSEIYE